MLAVALKMFNDCCRIGLMIKLILFADYIFSDYNKLNNFIRCVDRRGRGRGRGSGVQRQRHAHLPLHQEQREGKIRHLRKLTQT